MVGLLGMLVGVPSETAGQEAAARSDLHFFVGRWSVEREYVSTPHRPALFGYLTCQEALRGAYVHCRYELTNDETVIEEEVYFNFNSIYDRYEALWLSPTWPIKVIMGGSIQGSEFRALAEFPIEDGVVEYVRSQHRWAGDNAFEYDVAIRTSADPEGTGWRQHMVERATRIE